MIIRAKSGIISPVIRLIDYKGKKAVIKDFRPKGFFVRVFIAPFIVNHEYRILSILKEIEGVPKILEKGKNYLIFEYIDGKHIGRFKGAEDAQKIMNNLQDLLDKLHKKNIVHLDLRQKKNVIVDDKKNVYIIDFATALHLPQNLIFKIFCDLMKMVDKGALLKYKKKYFPYLLDEKETRFLRRFDSVKRVL